MKLANSIDRRHFVKTFAFATAYSSLLGQSWTNLIAGEVALQSAPSTGVLRLKLTDFPALQTESGSARIGINPLRGGGGGLMPDGNFYPIIVSRGPNNTFFALSSRCTHQGCTVDPLDSSTNEIHCPCHGSRYAIDGKRLGGPAPSALSKFPIAFDGNDTLTIQISSMAYTVTATSVPGSAKPRVRLDFRSFRNVDYEVQFRATLDQASSPVPFALTSEGALDQNVFSATSAASASLFVEPTTQTGFYLVTAKVVEL
ncbi:MAG: Rieske (2Fe-2S) protein [Verrucomicrobia bacterium]|nr:Rieske (2Fe-2S) protein [Verrucomicrobiota bacterium]